jgi:RNA polymerase sigma-70 factor (ECF subfamily)
MEDKLWNAIRNSDQQAFTEIYKAYYQFLFAYGIRLNGSKDLVKDAIHELFLEVWRRRTELPEVRHVGFYLRTILRRKIINAVPHGRLIEEFPAQHPAGVENSYEELLIRLQATEEMKEKVRKALLSLTQKQKEVIRMKFFDDKTYEEIAALTSTTPRTVYNQVYESLKTLRKYLSLLF